MVFGNGCIECLYKGKDSSELAYTPNNRLSYFINVSFFQFIYVKLHDNKHYSNHSELMNEAKPKLVERQYLLPFIMITSLFAMWGFANDITNPLVAGFKTLMEIPNAKAALIQLAFYGG